MDKKISFKINGFTYEFFKKATLTTNGITKIFYVKEYATSSHGLKAYCYVATTDGNGKEIDGRFRWIYKKYSSEVWKAIK